MLSNGKFKRSVAVLAIAVAGMFSFANCFGSFGVVKTLYSAHKNIKIGNGLVIKLVQTLLMYFPFYFLYGIGTFLDIVLFNLVEFWTGSNPVAMSEFDMDGKLVRHHKNGNESLTLTYSDFGKKLHISVQANGQTEEFVALKEHEGVFFKEIDGKLQKIEVTSAEVGSKTILKLIQDGKITSARVISTEELQMAEKKLAENLL